MPSAGRYSPDYKYVKNAAAGTDRRACLFLSSVFI
jgi:hypothetical protein